MVLQPGSNSFATWIEWFCNTDRMVLQCGSNGFATRIGNADRTVLAFVGGRGTRITLSFIVNGVM